MSDMRGTPASVVQMSRREHRRESKHLLMRATQMHAHAEQKSWPLDELKTLQLAVANTAALANVHALLSLEDK